MTYLDRITELNEEIMDNIHHSDEIFLSVIEERNHIIGEVMGGNKDWDDKYR